uniref:Uncharacterized protein n=1 Tax=Aegilops tauschii subsp. strangulata TaxID=200361 RepID=A0A452YI08_AEGTS
LKKSAPGYEFRIFFFPFVFLVPVKIHLFPQRLFLCAVPLRNFLFFPGALAPAAALPWHRIGLTPLSPQPLSRASPPPTLSRHRGPAVSPSRRRRRHLRH